MMIRIRADKDLPGAAEAVSVCLLACETCGIHEVEEGETCEWRIYFEAENVSPDTAIQLRDCLAAQDAELFDVSEPILIPRENWHDNWREYFKPVEISSSLTIFPSWDTAAAAVAENAGKLALLIEPGMAFGTGTHATTQLCLRMTEKVARQDELVLDVGTGSGILAIAALKLGSAHVVAVDNDPDVDENLRENLRLNNVPTSRCSIIIGLLDSVPAGPYNLILCNMLSREFLPILQDMAALLASGGRLILSGFLLTEKDEVEQAVLNAGLHIGQADSEGEWGAMVVSRT